MCPHRHQHKEMEEGKSRNTRWHTFNETVIGQNMANNNEVVYYIYSTSSTYLFVSLFFPGIFYNWMVEQGRRMYYHNIVSHCDALFSGIRKTFCQGRFKTTVTIHGVVDSYSWSPSLPGLILSHSFESPFFSPLSWLAVNRDNRLFRMCRWLLEIDDSG